MDPLMLIAGAALLAPTVATTSDFKPDSAQTTTTTPQSSEPPSPSTPTKAAPSADPYDQTDTSGDIIVTAQRREQSLQEVPIAVTAVSGKALTAQGVTNLTALPNVAPGLSLNLQGGNVRAFIRGVGSPSATGIDQSTAIFVDDVYMGGAANLYQLDDVSRIEVLKGPQGTLFGRNATAGVIQIFTRLPTQEFRLTAKAGYESYNTYFGSVFVSGGLAKGLSVSISAMARTQTDGWTRNIVLNKEADKGRSYTIRPKILWDLDGRTSVLLGGEISFSNYTYGANNSILPGTISAFGAPGVQNYDQQVNLPTSNDRPTRAAYLKIDHDFGSAELISISAYRTSDVNFYGDLDFGPTKVINAISLGKIHSFTQELRLQSDKGATLFGRNFSWIFGGYYLDRKERSFTTLSGAAIPATVISSTSGARQRVNSLSFFGDVTLEVLPRTELSLGARYNHDITNLFPSSTVVTATTTTTTALVNPKPRIEANVWTYRAVLNHRFSDNAMVYASYSKGYKPGGYGLLSPTTAPVNPETVNSVEIGAKTNSSDRKILFNVSAFHYNFSNIQVQIVGSNGIISTINAAKARIQGIEADLELRPVANLTLTASGSVLDGKYTSFLNGPTYVQKPATCTSTPPLPAPTGGNLTCARDLTGNQTVNTPPLKFSVAATYTVPFANGSKIDLNTNFSYTDHFYWFPSNNPLVRQPIVGVVNASVAWTSPNGRVTLQAYVRNAFDRRYPLMINESTTAFFRSLAEPRIIGGFVQFNF